jgi:hypothetical protein
MIFKIYIGEKLYAFGSKYCLLCQELIATLIFDKIAILAEHWLKSLKNFTIALTPGLATVEYWLDNGVLQAW